MIEVDDLPQMVSLSPEPVASARNVDNVRKELPEFRNQHGHRRHNWDAEAIEVLWRQDCDLGLTRHDFAPIRSLSEEDVPEKVARLDEEWCQNDCKLEGATAAEGSGDSLDDIWAGLDYTVDLETGEYVLRMPPSQPVSSTTATSTTAAATAVSSSVSALNPSSEDALLTPIPTTIDDLVSSDLCSAASYSQISESPASRVRRSTHSSDSGHESIDSGCSTQPETLSRLTPMADVTPSGAATRVRPLQRLVSAEQRWQDLVSVLHLPEQSAATAAAAAGAPVPTLKSPVTSPAAAPAAAAAVTVTSPVAAFTSAAALLHSPTVSLAHSSAVVPTAATADPGLHVQLEPTPHHPTPALPSPAEPSPSHSARHYSGNASTGMYISPMSESPVSEAPQKLPFVVNETSATQYYQLTPVVAAPAAEPPPSLDQDITFLSQLLGVDEIDMQEYCAPMPVQDAENVIAPEERASSPAPQLQELGAVCVPARAAAAAAAAAAGGSAPLANHQLPAAPQKKHHLFGKRINNAPQNNDEAPCREDHSPGDEQLDQCQPREGGGGGGARQRYGSEAGCDLSAGRQPHVPAPHEAAALVAGAGGGRAGGGQQRGAEPSHQRQPAAAHNHSYHQPSPTQASGSPRRPVARDKEERLSRDERRTREMNIPMTADEIVHLPMEEFNERLSKLQLSEAQLSLIKDVRRRGKNKLAAQNCRKRKLDQIQSLADDVQRVRDQRQRDIQANRQLARQRIRIRELYSQLHRHVFQSLRDEEGRPYSAAEYGLQLSADGDVLLVPRNTARGAAFAPPSAPGGHRDNAHN